MAHMQCGLPHWPVSLTHTQSVGGLRRAGQRAVIPQIDALLHSLSVPKEPMLRTLLLAAAAVVAVAAQPRAAVVFTDVKLDDKVGIDHLSCIGIYDHVTAVITGVKDTQRAHSDLRDFLNSMELLRAASVKCSPVFVLGVESMNEKPVPHEVNFIGDGIPVPSFVDNINGWFQSSTIVDIYQIAPTPKIYVATVADVNHVQVGRYHLVHGYNSKQWDDNGKESDVAQGEFLHNLTKYIRSKHENPAVVFTNNFASFEPAGAGSSQLYSDVKPFLPEDHLEAALNDPFHTKKLLEVQKALHDFGISIDATLFPDPESYGRDLQPTKEYLQALVLEARKNEPGTQGQILRQHFINYIDESVKALERVEGCDTKMLLRVKTHVLGAFRKPLSVELCDANHIAAVVDIMEERNTISGMCKANNMRGMKFVYNDGDGFFQFAPDDEAGDQMLYSLNAARCLALLATKWPK